MTSRSPPGCCTPPFCQQREPSIFPDLVPPSLQWPSSLPRSFEVLFVCLPNDVANMLKPTESSVSDDICNIYRGKGVISDLYIL